MIRAGGALPEAMRYGGRQDWNMVALAAWLFFFGREFLKSALS